MRRHSCVKAPQLLSIEGEQKDLRSRCRPAVPSVVVHPSELVFSNPSLRVIADRLTHGQFKAERFEKAPEGDQSLLLGVDPDRCRTAARVHHRRQDCRNGPFKLAHPYAVASLADGLAESGLKGRCRSRCVVGFLDPARDGRHRLWKNLPHPERENVLHVERSSVCAAENAGGWRRGKAIRPLATGDA